MPYRPDARVDAHRYATGGAIWLARHAVVDADGRVTRWSATPVRDCGWLRRLFGERVQPTANRDCGWLRRLFGERVQPTANRDGD